MDSDILQEIKNKTHNNHVRLEANDLLKSLTTKDLDFDTYYRILTRFYGFFSPIEEILNSNREIPVFLSDFKTRRKASLLKEDIEYIAERTGKGSTLETCLELPEVSNTSKAFGCIYVMEGSTLGGQFIFRNLEKTLHLSPNKGASFFYGYGSETGKRWKDFKNAFLDFSSKSSSNGSQSIAAAIETFEKLDNWLKK